MAVCGKVPIAVIVPAFSVGMMPTGAPAALDVEGPLRAATHSYAARRHRQPLQPTPAKLQLNNVMQKKTTHLFCPHQYSPISVPGSPRWATCDGRFGTTSASREPKYVVSTNTVSKRRRQRPTLTGNAHERMRTWKRDSQKDQGQQHGTHEATEDSTPSQQHSVSL